VASQADKPVHPENRGDRNPLKSKRLKREAMKKEFVPKKNMQPRAGGSDVNLPSPQPEVPAGNPSPGQPNPGDPVPVQQ
jgi:hypothetical protein